MDYDIDNQEFIWLFNWIWQGYCLKKFSLIALLEFDVKFFGNCTHTNLHLNILHSRWKPQGWLGDSKSKFYLCMYTDFESAFGIRLVP